MQLVCKDDYRAIFETVSWDNQLFLEEPADRFTNPGHSSEAGMVHLEYARSSGRENLLHRAVGFEDWVYERGYDKVYGGLNSYLDVNGTEPVAVDWFLATNSLWDDKVWWANAEQLCALAMTYEAGKNELYWGRFLRHHQYCRSNFFDPEYGEWFERLNADGSVKVDAKGDRVEMRISSCAGAGVHPGGLCGAWRLHRTSESSGRRSRKMKNMPIGGRNVHNKAAADHLWPAAALNNYPGINFAIRQGA